MYPAFLGTIFHAVTGATDVIGGVVGIGGFVWGLWRGKQLKKLISEIFDFIEKYRAAKADNKFTPEEVGNLVDELEDVAMAAVDVWKFWPKKKVA